MPAFLLSLIPGAGAASAALRFLTSSVGIGILAATIGFGFGFQTAGHNAELEAAKSQLAIVQKDLATTKGAAALATRQAGVAEAKLKLNQDKVHALEVDLRTRGPLGVCGLTDRDAAKLRDIR